MSVPLPTRLLETVNDTIDEPADCSISQSATALTDEDRLFASSDGLDSNALIPQIRVSQSSMSHGHVATWELHEVGYMYVPTHIYTDDPSSIEVCSWEEALQAIEDHDWAGTGNIIKEDTPDRKTDSLREDIVNSTNLPVDQPITPVEVTRPALPEPSATSSFPETADPDTHRPEKKTSSISSTPVDEDATNELVQPDIALSSPTASCAQAADDAIAEALQTQDASMEGVKNEGLTFDIEMEFAAVRSPSDLMCGETEQNASSMPNLVSCEEPQNDKSEHIQPVTDQNTSNDTQTSDAHIVAAVEAQAHADAIQLDEAHGIQICTLQDVAMLSDEDIPKGLAEASTIQHTIVLREPGYTSQSSDVDFDDIASPADTLATSIAEAATTLKDEANDPEPRDHLQLPECIGIPHTVENNQRESPVSTPAESYPTNQGPDIVEDNQKCVTHDSASAIEEIGQDAIKSTMVLLNGKSGASNTDDATIKSNESQSFELSGTSNARVDQDIVDSLSRDEIEQGDHLQAENASTTSRASRRFTASAIRIKQKLREAKWHYLMSRIKGGAGAARALSLIKCRSFSSNTSLEELPSPKVHEDVIASGIAPGPHQDAATCDQTGRRETEHRPCDEQLQEATKDDSSNDMCPVTGDLQHIPALNAVITDTNTPPVVEPSPQLPISEAQANPQTPTPLHTSPSQVPTMDMALLMASLERYVPSTSTRNNALKRAVDELKPIIDPDEEPPLKKRKPSVDIETMALEVGNKSQIVDLSLEEVNEERGCEDAGSTHVEDQSSCQVDNEPVDVSSTSNGNPPTDETDSNPSPLTHPPHFTGPHIQTTDVDMQERLTNASLSASPPPSIPPPSSVSQVRGPRITFKPLKPPTSPYAAISPESVDEVLDDEEAVEAQLAAEMKIDASTKLSTVEEEETKTQDPVTLELVSQTAVKDEHSSNLETTIETTKNTPTKLEPTTPPSSEPSSPTSQAAPTLLHELNFGYGKRTTRSETRTISSAPASSEPKNEAEETEHMSKEEEEEKDSIVPEAVTAQTAKDKRGLTSTSPAQRQRKTTTAKATKPKALPKTTSSSTKTVSKPKKAASKSTRPLSRNTLARPSVSPTTPRPGRKGAAESGSEKRMTRRASAVEEEIRKAAEVEGNIGRRLRSRDGG